MSGYKEYTLREMRAMDEAYGPLTWWIATKDSYDDDLNVWLRVSRYILLSEACPHCGCPTDDPRCRGCGATVDTYLLRAKKP